MTRRWSFTTCSPDLVDRAFVFMGVGIWLSFLVSSNLTRPLQQIIQVLRRVRKGDFEGKVAVTSNDEIGYTGDAINEMTEGLKERDFIKDTFGKYVTSEIRDEILSGTISLDGELKNVTMLFSDLREFYPDGGEVRTQNGGTNHQHLFQGNGGGHSRPFGPGGAIYRR